MSTISTLPVRLSEQSSDVPATKTVAQEDPLANKETFLRLLVAQLQNQNPLDPSDPMQYVTQLTQFSELEQALGIRSEIASIRSTIDAWANRPETSPADSHS